MKEKMQERFKSESLNEFLERLGDRALILPQEESEAVFEVLKRAIPICGTRIDWRQVENKVNIPDLDEAIPVLQGLLKFSIAADRMVYILWDDADLPVVKTRLELIFSNFDDFACISWNAWLYNPFDEYVVEIYPGGVNAGLFPLNIEQVESIKILEPIDSTEELEKVAIGIISDHPQQVATYKTGNKKLLSFFMGEGMKKTNKMANARLLQSIFERLLS